MTRDRAAVVYAVGAAARCEGCGRCVAGHSLHDCVRGDNAWDDYADEAAE